MSAPPAPLAVGFDLDMTLIDTVPGFARVLEVLGAELGVEFPAAEMTSKLGPPLEMLLEPYLAAEAIGPAGDRFRALYPDHAIASVPVLPGAHEALAAVRAHGGRTVVVTGKYPDNARRHQDHLGLDVDVLEGWVWGVGKAEVLRREGVSVYVGDHVHDVEGALAAGVLERLGADRRQHPRGAARGRDARRPATRSTEFPAWLDEHLLTTRLAALEADLRDRGSVLVAYSGGADSAFLLAAAVRAVGADRVVAATGYSHSLPEVERDPARAFAESLGVEVLTPETHEMEREGYRANGADRCFFCKAELVEVLSGLAEQRGLAVVATGTNADDAVAGFRPGIRAADERGAVAPLRDAGLTKAQVREASRRWGLPTWDKPAAACLSSRVAYGVEVTPYALARVERAEAAVRRELPSVRDLRVRDLGADRASVEVDAVLLPLDDALVGTGRGRRPRRRFRGGRDRPAGLPVGLDERGPVAVTLDAADVLAEAAAWVWVPTTRGRSGRPSSGSWPTRATTRSRPWPSTSTRPGSLRGSSWTCWARRLRWTGRRSRSRASATPPGRRPSSPTWPGEVSCARRSRCWPADWTTCPRSTSRTTSKLRQVQDVATLSDAGHVATTVFGGTPRTPEEVEAAVAHLSPTDPSWVAYRSGVPVGAAGVALVEGVARLWGGSVVPDAQHTGVYRALLARRLQHARDAGRRMALVKGRVETSAPILRRAGFAAYGEERAYRVTAA